MTIETPPIGTTVQFFLGADDTRDPQAGIVTQCGKNGMVRICLIPPNGGTVKAIRGYVRHMDDPWIPENREFYRRHKDAGAYREVPPYPSKKPGNPSSAQNAHPKAESKDKAPSRERHQEGLEKAEQLLEQGESVQEVFERVRAYGVKKSEVEGLQRLQEPVGA